jgi:hypothetical protein
LRGSPTSIIARTIGATAILFIVRDIVYRLR